MASLNRMKVKQHTYYVARNISKIVQILKIFVLTFQQPTWHSFHLSPLTSVGVGAPQMTLQQCLSTLPCLPLPTGNLQTPFLSIPWCYLNAPKEKWAATWQNQQCGCAPSEDSDQPGHPPSLIRVFAVRMKKAWVLSYLLSVQRRLWSDWADAQVDLSLRWAHTHFVGFVMSRFNG